MKREMQKQPHKDVKDSILNKISNSDYMHIAYLRPIQLVLKPTPPKDGKKQLTNGLKLVNRSASGENQNQFDSQDFNLDTFEKLLIKGQKQQKSSKFRQSMHQDNHDNMLLHMMMYRQMELLICICMYNEPKDMLDYTLAGVGQNIYNLANQYKVNPDKIAVIILADGMAKISPTVVDWSQMMLKQSGMYLSDDIPERTLEQMKQEEMNNKNLIDLQDDQDEQMNNYNIVMFDPVQLQMRKNQRFAKKKKQYDQIIVLVGQVTKMLNQKVTPVYQKLPQRAKNIFAQQAKKYYEYQNGESFQEAHKTITIDVYAQQNYLNNNLIGPKLIRDTLTTAKNFCNQYINSRDQITHTSFYRTSRYFPKAKIQRIQSNASLTEQDYDDQTKMNIFFCAKYKNAQKLSSHNWFFNGFCRQLNPKYAVLLDVGLKPDSDAICRMYVALSNDQDLGGVCGYMGLKIQKAESLDVDFFTSVMHFFVDVQRAQQMEYHFAHIIDKPFQSFFNFIHVLPGAFSGYNMKAIRKQGDKLLNAYFKSINDKISQTEDKDSNFSVSEVMLRTVLPSFLSDCCYKVHQNSQQMLIYNQNVYLAEDRILCMEIHQNGYKLQYLPDAFASVDPMKSLPDLLGQRKRWINGSFFAFSKVKKTLSKGQCCSEIGLHFQTYYLAFMNMLGFVGPALFLFTVYIAMQAFRADVLVNFLSNLISPDSQIYNAFVITMNFIYVMMIGGLIFYSMNLTNKNQQFVSYVYGVSTVMGIMSIIVFVVLTVDLIRGLSGTQSFLISNSQFIEAIPGGQSTIDLLRFIILGIIGLYTLPVMICVIFFCRLSILFQVLLGVLSFIFYTPTYVSILNIYALCRMDDLSWGTKGLQTAGSSKNKDIQQFWKVIKTIHVAKFVFWNVVVGGLLLHFGDDFIIRFWITFAIMIIIGVTMAIKVAIAIAYYFQYRFCTQTKKLKSSLKISQTFNQKFKKIKSHYVESINQKITDLMANIQKQDNILQMTQKNIFKSQYSRIYMTNKKIEGQINKNKARVQQSKISKSRQIQQRKTQAENTAFNLKYPDSPDKKSQNSQGDLLLNKNTKTNQQLVLPVQKKKKKALIELKKI